MTSFMLVRHPKGLLALEAALVERVLSRPLLFGLPGSQPHVLGVFRLGGRLIPVVDLDRRWGAPSRPAALEDRLVVTMRGVALRAGEPAGLVEAEVLPLADEALLLPEALPYLRGALALPGGGAAVLDLERVLALPEEPAEVREALSAGWSEEDLAVLAERGRALEQEAEGPAPVRTRAVAVVRVGEARYALPLEGVREFFRPGRVVPVPGAPPDLLGVVLLRGRVVPVLDGRRLLGQEGEGRPEVALVIPRPEAAVAVDEVEEICEVEVGGLRAGRVDRAQGAALLVDLAALIGTRASKSWLDGGRG